MSKNSYPSDNEPILERRKEIKVEDDYPWEKKIQEKHSLKVLLINPPAIVAYGKYKAAAKVGASPQMPLGLLYIATVLKKAGHKIKVIDSDIDGYNLGSIIKEIKENRPSVVGITATTPIFQSVIEIIKQIKTDFSDVITFIGGYHFTALPIQSMENCPADYGFYGEAEATVTELINYLGECKAKKNKIDPIKLKTIDGLLFRHNSKIIINKKRPLIKDLDRIPFPRREFLRYKKYEWSVPKKGLIPVTSITTQRGCPFQCTFCGAQTMFPGIRYRSNKNIIEELDYLVNNLKIHHIQFQDDTLTLNRKKIEEMSKLIKKNNLRFTWEGYTRANTIDEPLLRLLQSVGLVRLSFGVESGNEKILKAIKKGIKKEDFVKAYDICHKLKIETRCSLMLGHPFETKDTIKETIEFAKKLKCYQAYINITMPYPGSELLEEARKGFGGIKLLTENWDEYRRYGNSVMEMNGLSVKDLVKYQKWGYKQFYLRPHIIWYNISRAGFKAAIINGIAFLKSVFG